jgi:ribosomal protein L20A (L18A)
MWVGGEGLWGHLVRGPVQTGPGWAFLRKVRETWGTDINKWYEQFSCFHKVKRKRLNIVQIKLQMREERLLLGREKGM